MSVSLAEASGPCAVNQCAKIHASCLRPLALPPLPIHIVLLCASACRPAPARAYQLWFAH